MKKAYLILSLIVIVAASGVGIFLNSGIVIYREIMGTWPFDWPSNDFVLATYSFLALIVFILACVFFYNAISTNRSHLSRRMIQTLRWLPLVLFVPPTIVFFSVGGFSTVCLQALTDRIEQEWDVEELKIWLRDQSIETLNNPETWQDAPEFFKRFMDPKSIRRPYRVKKKEYDKDAIWFEFGGGGFSGHWAVVIYLDEGKEPDLRSDIWRKAAPGVYVWHANR